MIPAAAFWPFQLHRHQGTAFARRSCLENLCMLFSPRRNICKIICIHFPQMKWLIFDHFANVGLCSLFSRRLCQLFSSFWGRLQGPPTLNCLMIYWGEDWEEERFAEFGFWKEWRAVWRAQKECWYSIQDPRTFCRVKTFYFFPGSFNPLKWTHVH